MNENKSMLEKIRSLFRLADTSRGATRAEAELAMQRAQEMMTKYGISKIDVADVSEEARSARKFNIHKREYRTGRPRYPTDQYIARILRECFNVRVVWSTSFEKIKVKKWTLGNRYVQDATGQWWSTKERLVYILVGEPEDTEIAEMAAGELHRMMRGLFDAYMRENYRQGFWAPKRVIATGLEPKTALQQEMEDEDLTVEEVRHGFLQGVQDGFIAASERGRESAEKSESKERVNAYAIVLVDKSEAILKWQKENISTVPSKFGYGSRSGNYGSHAHSAGYAHGSKMKVGLKKIE